MSSPIGIQPKTGDFKHIQTIYDQPDISILIQLLFKMGFLIGGIFFPVVVGKKSCWLLVYQWMSERDCRSAMTVMSQPAWLHSNDDTTDNDDDDSDDDTDDGSNDAVGARERSIRMSPINIP